MERELQGLVELGRQTGNAIHDLAAAHNIDALPAKEPIASYRFQTGACERYTTCMAKSFRDTLKPLVSQALLEQ